MFRKINPLSLEGRGTKLLVSVSELTISGVGDGTNSRFELAQGDSSVTSFPQNDMKEISQKPLNIFQKVCYNLYILMV